MAILVFLATAILKNQGSAAMRREMNDFHILLRALEEDFSDLRPSA